MRPSHSGHFPTTWPCCERNSETQSFSCIAVESQGAKGEPALVGPHRPNVWHSSHSDPSPVQPTHLQVVWQWWVISTWSKIHPFREHRKYLRVCSYRAELSEKSCRIRRQGQRASSLPHRLRMRQTPHRRSHSRAQSHTNH